jgi:hypothetical protein
MLHAAIVDAASNIDQDFQPYAVHHPYVSRRASIRAAADQAAHDVLITLYPLSDIEQDASETDISRPEILLVS